jgi:pilus assembly protein TadC
VVDELDFWGGTFFLVIFATVEVILFAWIFGMENAWDEIHKGADMAIPRIYKYIIKYITPLFLFFILGMWFWQQWLSLIVMKNVSGADRPYVLFTRLGLLAIFIALAIMVYIAWRRKKRRR